MSEWIKLHASSFAHPKLRRLARRLELPPAALGHLASLWCFAAEFAPDGDLSSLEVEEIAEYAGWMSDAELFVSAATAAGLLDREGNLLVLHDWADWGGRLAERRVAERQRSAERRASAPRPPVDRSATAGRPLVDRSVSAGLPPLEKIRTEETRRDERRREESRGKNKNTPLARPRLSPATLQLPIPMPAPLPSGAPTRARRTAGRPRRAGRP
jgi:hypothetical protein